ncbi:MAG: hypothetical protein JGK17_28230 [Microcoleus sp. PH2017_10_PVI_O_A]|uniref:hypothetical protein n=1 Tax=unclassified Microcoleus TaxID=2642155 RepID=UPI001D5DA985|nr:MULTISPECIES: hypothetical protein [unclassified Microcoleus]MCC3409375.1 hypothetical protein [Microcoleus sp. PH2017_10_PVI_O_A]MCC3463618.1 hypothetical protein [Microcoleus sp. PH2017_11_PCY_U_A]MCC3481974.1 hypothetical protein [Microcoleus sp. PH2017_12_PCY_D_A]MCC3530743.1 hypothetical protein [Microcoleus sp. PH2017_21_RUC_O_A]MCC3543111.1 hypothetical protein [Microcoleus sp. PH2017_22_RUC_O_B]
MIHDSALYFNYPLPISFGGVDPSILHQKSVTRRKWKETHAAKYLNAYDLAQQYPRYGYIRPLRVPALNKGFYAKGKRIGSLIITHRPYLEKLSDMPHSDLLAEGGMCESVTDFAAKFFKGDLNLEVCVIRYQFVPLEVSE